MDPRADPSDADLLAASARNPDAFVRFYDRYEPALVGYFMRRTGKAELAADLTAEVFAAVLASAPRYRPESPTAAAWLFTIARNTLAKSVRRGRVQARARTRIRMRQVELHDETIERIEASSGGEGWVEALLDRLTADQRDAVRARILDERPYGDIARELRTSELVIRKRVSRGLATLRKELNQS